MIFLPVPLAVALAFTGAGQDLQRLSLADSAHLFAATETRLFASTDGGARFVDRTPAGIAKIDALFAEGAMVALAEQRETKESAKVRVYISSDRGVHFSRVDVPSALDSHGVSLQAGPAGELLVRVDDNGGMNSHHETVTAIRAGQARRVGEKTGYGSILFDSATRWRTVGSCCTSPGSLYISTDAGATWSEKLSPSSPEGYPWAIAYSKSGADDPTLFAYQPRPYVIAGEREADPATYGFAVNGVWSPFPPFGDDTDVTTILPTNAQGSSWIGLVSSPGGPALVTYTLGAAAWRELHPTWPAPARAP